MHEPSLSEVIIVGAGPAGLALSVSLALAGIRSTVLEQGPLDALAQPPEDGRDIALTHPSRRLLEALGLWQRLPADEIAPLRQAQVIDASSPRVLPFDGRRQGHEALGWLVPNHRLRAAAFADASALAAVRLQGRARIIALERHGAGATVHAADGRSWSAALVVAADSRFSGMRRLAGIGARSLDFGRTAVVSRVEHEREHEGIALECFRYGNTLALLPMAGRQSSAVLTLPSDEVPQWLALDDAEFARRIESQLDGRLGAVRAAQARHAYPLVAVYAHHFVAHRFALVGDAAVGMHPVTAHGYNFGLGGVQSLTRCLARADRAGRDIGELASLQAYEQEHRRATLPIYLGTNAIVGLFTDDRPPARLLRGAVLRVARALPPLRQAIARQLTGAAPAGV